MGNASKQRCHPRHVSVIFPRLVCATEENFIDRFPIAFSELFPQSPQWNCGEIVRADLRERSAVPPDRRSYSLTNKCRRHSCWFPLPIRSVLSRRRRGLAKTEHAFRVPVKHALLDVVRITEFIPFAQQTHIRNARIIASKQNFLLQPAANVAHERLRKILRRIAGHFPKNVALV